MYFAALHKTARKAFPRIRFHSPDVLSNPEHGQLGLVGLAHPKNLGLGLQILARQEGWGCR
jgi:hypothetical protein